MDKNEEKDFDGWIEVKSNVHFAGRVPRIREGEIWWCAVGENVGIEINGKSNAFSRPVLVLKKLTRLYKKIGMIPNSDLQIVKGGFRNLYFD